MDVELAALLVMKVADEALGKCVLRHVVWAVQKMKVFCGSAERATHHVGCCGRSQCALRCHDRYA